MHLSNPIGHRRKILLHALMPEEELRVAEKGGVAGARRAELADRLSDALLLVLRRGEGEDVEECRADRDARELRQELRGLPRLLRGGPQRAHGRARLESELEGEDGAASSAPSCRNLQAFERPTMETQPLACWNLLSASRADGGATWFEKVEFQKSGLPP